MCIFKYIEGFCHGCINWLVGLCSVRFPIHVHMIRKVCWPCKNTEYILLGRENIPYVADFYLLKLKHDGMTALWITFLYDLLPLLKGKRETFI